MTALDTTNQACPENTDESTLQWLKGELNAIQGLAWSAGGKEGEFDHCDTPIRTAQKAVYRAALTIAKEVERTIKTNMSFIVDDNEWISACARLQTVLRLLLSSASGSYDIVTIEELIVNELNVLRENTGLERLEINEFWNHSEEDEETTESAVEVEA